MTKKLITKIILFLGICLLCPCAYSFQCDLQFNDGILKEELKNEFGTSEVISYNNLDSDMQEKFNTLSKGYLCPGITWDNSSSLLYLLIKRQKETLLVAAFPVDSEDRSWGFKPIDSFKGNSLFMYKLETEILLSKKKIKAEKARHGAIRIVSSEGYSIIYIYGRNRQFYKIKE